MKKFNSITVKTKTACYYYMKTTIEISEIFALKKKNGSNTQNIFFSFFLQYLFLSLLLSFLRLVFFC